MWGDVDLVAGLLRIKRTVYKSKFFAPKSKAAIRTVDLGDSHESARSRTRHHGVTRDKPA
jgi:hypothetical protein